ncbi:MULTISPECIES: nuclear transport factor 2 family protein [Enterobacter]|uniref:nuclear transport factor 2 family protein n=1 Tax=Enterobacter TaxID=547 RepID=UPI0010CA35C0|nr:MULTISPECIES: nuclear transport factor 2 family protein [Enterobacter]MCG7803969.1 nuclear transport factor 2 family protein [Enterobacter asburiae]UAN18749.1 nuclear transport factor 2 family protein [Enterobacter asburiae]UAN24679.1 nuclear transport factor 2 family protein [Enterobacter sp. JBIWA003]UAN34212.1 nuclear transport factor 2 family protein [Enterobacter sp. JBIWA005]UKU10091.1 hypothetical protein [Enterobacter asburiae]
MVIKEIQEFLGSYFDVLQHQDLSLFDRVFHRDCVLYSQQQGNTIVRPLSEYRKMVKGRKSPEEGGFPRSDEVLMIDVLASDMALAKVRLRLFDNIMIDYLNLMKVDGQWQIVSKLFYRVE